MSENGKYWGRVGYVDIDGVKIPNGLDFKFDVNYIADFAVEFKCSILGLSLDTIKKITVWNDAMAFCQRRGIRIYAGYRDIVGPKRLINGFILNALPTTPPEMWLNISGQFNFADMRVISDPFVTYASTAHEVFDKMCEVMNMPGRWEVKRKDAETEWTSFEFSGMYSSLPRKFSEKYDLLCYDDQGTLVAFDKNGQYGEPEDVNSHTINIDHGLIGITSLDMSGAKIKVRMSDSYKLNSWIKLDSKIIPSANGVYYVIGKRHVGHLRGDDWYTELDTLRKV